MAFPGLTRLFRLAVRPPPVEQDVDAEIGFHLVVVAVVLLAVAGLASLVPAWRAGRADPISALRVD